MRNWQDISNLYFLGIGGIGMSALARYANRLGKNVLGYDRTETELTRNLEREGMTIIYDDDTDFVPYYLQQENCLVIYTPAVPKETQLYKYFIANDYDILKRSEMLGVLTRGQHCIAIAGTHGKTSVSTMVAHNLHTAGIKCGAFLGGISANFNSNLVMPDDNSDLVVTEADEFDRSFLRLYPNTAVITSIDADHLDIYGSYDEIRNAFGEFINKIEDNGLLISKKGIDLPVTNKSIKYQTYSVETQADYYVLDLGIEDGFYCFDLKTPDGIIKDVQFCYPGRVNVENFVASAAVALNQGASFDQIKAAAQSYRGVKRRFEMHINQFGITYIDDYAHHPKEIEATIHSVKELFEGRKVLGIFQPHLYSRTNDLAVDFAKTLSLLDEVIVLDIYPARELPIEGVNSEMILSKIEIDKKMVCSKDRLMNELDKRPLDVVITMGAGDIDQMVNPIIEMLNRKQRRNS